MARKKAGDSKVRVGNVSRISGKVTIAGGDIYEGYTVEQVSLLLKEITTDYHRKPFDGRCPYKGLDVFEEEDAELFFGRERLVEDLLSRVKESRTVFITGPSGSGKSSLVRAGLLHALKQGAIKGSNSWLYETMKPGREPIKDLALAFSRLKGPDLEDYFQAHADETDILNKCAESVLSGRKDQRFVLFVDQFEEAFTQVSGEEERLAFLGMLAHAGTVENGRVIILFAMRSDFVSNCATYPMLNELLSQQFRQIGAMQPEELVSAIALPARQVGLPVEDELIARIINDMKGEPGALPLMQFALKDLFDSKQAKGGVIALTLEDYLKHGGIQKSLERHADASLAALDEEGQTLARSIFGGLIEIGRGTQDTKRTALFEELVPANTKVEDVEAIVRKLADARLVITDEQAGKDTVTISHEKLIDAWPWLKKLVNENRDVIALQNEIANDAKEWEDHRRDPSYLYTGARLANAREQLNARKLVLSDMPQEFIEAGVKSHTEELEATRQREAQLRKRSFFLAAALFVALLAIGVAVLFSIRSQQQAKIAQAGEIAALALSQREQQFDLSLLLSVEAFHQQNIPRTRGLLINNTNINPSLVQFMSRHQNTVTSVDLSSDGKTLASGSFDKTIILWDVESQEPVGRPLTGHTGTVNSVAFSPDGKTLASGSDDGTIILWNVESQLPMGKPLTDHTDTVYSVAFSPDGKTLASGSFDNTIILWDVESQKQIGRPLEKHTDFVTSVTFSPDGKTLASGSGDGTVILWDTKTREAIFQTDRDLPVRGYISQIFDVAFSPDGKTLASGSTNGLIRLWEVSTGRSIGERMDTGQPVTSITFNPNGQTLASACDCNAITLWDVDNQRALRQLRGHSGEVTSLDFSPDGTTLASGSTDKSLVLWRLSLPKPLGQVLIDHTGVVTSVAFSPDGRILASGSNDKSIIFWDIENQKPIGSPLTAHTDGITSVAFSPDGRTLASGSNDKSIILWDVRNQKPISRSLTAHTDFVTSVAFSPDGKILASGSADNSIILWDVENQKPIGPSLTGHTGSVTSLAFSSDGKTLASGSADNSIILWDVESQKPIGQRLIQYHDSVISIAFSPDGKTLASGNADNSIILWDVKSHLPIGLSIQAYDVGSLTFSPDGKILASAGESGTSLWDIENSHLFIGDLISEGINSIAFSPDGKTIASGGADTTIILWNLNPEVWAEANCKRAGRNFTSDEWKQYFPQIPYPTRQEDATCPKWPLEPASTPRPSSTQ